MKNFIVLVIILCVHSAFGQNTYTDSRDNNVYRTADINGTVWMLDNMKLVSKRSRQPSQEEKDKHHISSTTGRYYHFQEVDNICPEGWRLPTFEDWTSYLNYLAIDYDTLELISDTVEDPHHHYIEGFYGVIDLFEEGNPLNLQPVGRYQGEALSTSFDTPFADYWAHDPNEDIQGTSHVHIWEVINVHSQEHHMNPEKEDELRRFMCRCIKEK